MGTTKPSKPAESDIDAYRLTITNFAHKAGVVGDANMGAIITSLDVAAESFGTTNLYRRHDATLGEAEMALVGGAPAGSVAAEHVRHLQTRPRHRRIVSSATPSRC